jgi:hypothetical protein
VVVVVVAIAIMRAPKLKAHLQVVLVDRELF